MVMLVRVLELLIFGLVICAVVVGFVLLIEYVRTRYVSQLGTPGDAERVQARERLLTLRRDSYTCQLCGKHPAYYVHQIQPPEHGGPDTTDNLITLCDECEEQVQAGRRNV